MNKIICSTLGAMLFALSVTVEAQQPTKVPRIGFLSSASPSSFSVFTEAFRQGLRDLGYVEGKNILIEYRYAGGVLDRLPMLAGELVGLKVDVIVAAGGLTLVSAAKKVTDSIPIVMTNSADPVASGIVASLAHPGGNVTGLSTLARELGDKRLELLKDTIPKLSRVAVVGGPNLSVSPQIKEIEIAGRALGVRIQRVQMAGVEDLEKAIAATIKECAGALMTMIHPMFTGIRGRLADHAVKNRLPTMFPQPEAVEAGILMAYGPDTLALYRRAATYVDKILKGRKPADLPIEQPTKFEFIVNLRTAKLIGLTIPPNVLARADRVLR
jgi:putative tryptophan/tyrosine transport system substrate-binding protein